MTTRTWALVLLTMLAVFGPIRMVLGQSATSDQRGPEAGSRRAAADSVQSGISLEPGWGGMTPEQRKRAIAYSGTRHTLYFVGVGYSLAVLLVILLTGFSAKLLDWCRKIATRRFTVLLLYLLAFQVVYAAATFPLDFYQGYHVEHRFGLSNQSFGAWLVELFKTQAITLVLLMIVVGILYALIRRYPRSWWAWFGAGSVPFAVFIFVVAPVVITPMFYHTTPLADGPLKTQIQQLAQASGIADSRIFVVDASKDTKKLNAYVTGLGRTKRIVLFDNLLNSMAPPEILFVVGHEMGHYILHHVWIVLFMVVAFVFLFGYIAHRIMPGVVAVNQARLGFGQLSSFASIPLFMLCVTIFGFFASPIQNGLWRHFEHQADVFGLDKTLNGEAAAGAFEKMASVNLSNPNPSPFVKSWLYDHPTLSERVRFARSYSSEGAGGGGASAGAPSKTASDSLRLTGEKHLANLKQLTFGGENAEAYFDGTGRLLSFQSSRDNYGCDRIFIMGTDGSNVRQISVGGGVTTCAFFAPDNGRLIYSSTYQVDDSCPPKPSYAKGYVWPLYKGYDIFSVKPDGTDFKRLTDTPEYDAEAVYSPDGSKILFTSARDGDLELYTMNPDGTNPTRLTHEVGYDGGAFFSSDGKRIVYRAYHPVTPEAIADYKQLLSEGLIRPSTLEIFVMDTDGSNKRQITRNGAANFCPYFHPNGRQIIFVSNMDDPKKRNFEIYLINVDGTSLERVTYNESFDGFPMFNKDGTKLVFASNRHGSRAGETNIFIADWVE